MIGTFHEWRLANRLASQAEALAFDRLMRLLDKKGDGPTDEQVANAKHLRGVANDLFAISMRETADRAKALRSKPYCH